MMMMMMMMMMMIAMKFYRELFPARNIQRFLPSQSFDTPPLEFQFQQLKFKFILKKAM